MPCSCNGFDCCLSRWHGSETNQEDIAHIAAGICWLKKHLGQPEQDVVAVTNRSFLRARWQREGITIAGRKTDFVILTARALESLNLQPGQEPHAEALASMVKWIIALYESKTTKCLEGAKNCLYSSMIPGV